MSERDQAVAKARLENQEIEKRLRRDEREEKAKLRKKEIKRKKKARKEAKRRALDENSDDEKKKWNVNVHGFRTRRQALQEQQEIMEAEKEAVRDQQI